MQEAARHRANTSHGDEDHFPNLHREGRTSQELSPGLGSCHDSESQPECTAFCSCRDMHFLANHVCCSGFLTWKQDSESLN